MLKKHSLFRSPECQHWSLKFDDFAIGEQIVVSGREPMFIAMASGLVFKTSQNFITIRTDR